MRTCIGRCGPKYIQDVLPRHNKTRDYSTVTTEQVLNKKQKAYKKLFAINNKAAQLV